MNYSYEYPRPMLTVDAVILYFELETWNVLLINRGNYPYKGMWALPGGFVDMDEDLLEAVRREVKEETNLEITSFTQLGAYGKPNRDPRGRNVAIVHYVIVEQKIKAIAGDDASDARWFSVNNLPELAFDHQEIINDAIKKVR